MEQRENFGSRLGFLLVSAGCAIGIGNVWRFPFITGQYGGAAFVLLYLFFLVILGWPVMTMEFAVGRGSGKSASRGLEILSAGDGKKKWGWFKWFCIAGNYILMMYYTTVAGWMLSYVVKMARGTFAGMDVGGAGQVFSDSLASPSQQIIWMLVVTAIGFLVCARGLQNGVEKITKPMMLVLFALMVVLAVRSVTLEGAADGLAFYLIPNFKRAMEQGIWDVIFAAMGQAFFTLSLGIGSIAIFGSYIGKERSLPGESRTVIILDTFVAIMAGLIIFPSCFAYGVTPDAGPQLIFITLPEVFARMAGGRLWGTIFFIFMCFASLSTVIAVFENIIAMIMDAMDWSRSKSVAVNAVLLTLLSIPCPLGYNLLSRIQPLGAGSTILDFEDFIVSNNLLPIGSLVFVLFCCARFGWGFDGFLKEANTGEGAKFGSGLQVYFRWVLPVIILVILVGGYINFFR